MRKFSFVLAMLAITLVFGLTLVSCGGDDGNNNTPGGNTPGGNNPGGSIDPVLNGTWVNNVLSTSYLFNNGIYERKNPGLVFTNTGKRSGDLHTRGTYTTATVGTDYSTGRLIMKFMLTTTDIYFTSAFADFWNTTTAGWVNRSQFIEIVQHYNDVGVDDIGIDYALNLFGFNGGLDYNYYFENLGGSVTLFIDGGGTWFPYTSQ